MSKVRAKSKPKPKPKLGIDFDGWAWKIKKTGKLVGPLYEVRPTVMCNWHEVGCWVRAKLVEVGNA